MCIMCAASLCIRDEASYLAGYCSTSPSLSNVGGLLDNSIAQNKFSPFTLIVPLYCSGNNSHLVAVLSLLLLLRLCLIADVFVVMFSLILIGIGDLFLADSVKTWNDAAGVPVEQRGFRNAQAVLNWTWSQQAQGHLSSPVEEFVLMGNSAGAVAAPVWADRVFSTVSASKKAVVADSFILFMPSNFEGLLFRDSANFCSSQLLPSSLSSSCAAGETLLHLPSTRT